MTRFNEMKSFERAVQDMAAEGIGVEAQEQLAKNRRAAQVKHIWESLVEEAILKHTNSVYIIQEDRHKTLHVYVDESIYAAELNNRREMILMLIKERFGEEVDFFQIHISRGSMKKRHPFTQEEGFKVVSAGQNRHPSKPLEENELALVEQAAANIEDAAAQEAFKKAMIADLQWKKSLNQ